MQRFINKLTQVVYWFDPEWKEWYRETGIYLDPCRTPAGVQPAYTNYEQMPALLNYFGPGGGQGQRRG